MRSMDGISGLSQTGVKELHYRMIFLAQHIKQADNRYARDGVERY